MAKYLRKFVAFLAVVAIACASCGCKSTRTTEVKDKPFGGTQVKEKTVTETGDKAVVTEKKTDYNTQGDKTKTETKTTGNTGTP